MAEIFRVRVKLQGQPDPQDAEPDDAATIGDLLSNTAMPEPPDDDKVYGRTREPGEMAGDWQEILGGGAATADQVLVGNNLTVTNAVGGYALGSTVSATDSLWGFIQQLLNPRVGAQYVQPTLSLAGTPLLYREVGISFTTTLTPTWTQNDAGPVTQYRLYRPGGSTHTGPTPVPVNDTVMEIVNNVTFTAQVDYAQGPVKDDSKGDPDPTGQIPAGTVTATVTYIAARRAFWGRLESTTVPNANQIRLLGGNTFDPQNNTIMIVDLVAGDRGCLFAYPAILRPVSSIVQQGLGTDVKAGFTAMQMFIPGFNDFDPIPYRVYYILPEFPFGGAERYTLTI